MSLANTADKRDRLLEYERQQARRLAGKVIDKPRPPVWMILIPVFFVFFAWKMREYKNGLRNFATHWMITRERCLDAAYDAVVAGKDPEVEKVVAAAKEIPPKVLPHYREWITILTHHYCLLLAADGGTVRELVRNRFRSKSTYLLTIKQINTIEHTYHKALLPTMPGEGEDLSATVAKIRECVTEQQREQVEEIFS